MNFQRVSGTSLKGRTALVTGTAGLGLVVAREFARAGADVIVAGRNPEAGAEAVSGIVAQAPAARARFEPLDLASLSSVAALAGRLAQDGAALDLLVCNAGIMSPPVRRTTVEGFELQFGVNYLGHFALTGLLLPLLRKASSARVVTVTSLAQHYVKSVDFDDLQSQRRYVAGKAYCLSKFAQASFARELERRSIAGRWGIVSLAAHPGLARTNLFEGDHAKTGLLKKLLPWLMGHVLGQSAESGAQSIIEAATSPSATGGELYGPKGRFEMKGTPGVCRFATATDDPATAARLWRISEGLTGVRFP